MKKYYYETKTGFGSFNCKNDDEALKEINKNNWLVLYRESDTDDGLPFIIVWERGNG